MNGAAGVRRAVITWPELQLVDLAVSSRQDTVVGNVVELPVSLTNELLEETPPTGWLNVATMAPVMLFGIEIEETVVGPTIEKQAVQTE